MRRVKSRLRSKRQYGRTCQIEALEDRLLLSISLSQQAKVGATGLTVLPSTVQTIDFEGLPAMGNLLHSPVPDNVKLSDQLLASFGVRFRSESKPYVAVVDLSKDHTGGSNTIGGVNADDLLAYENPIFISFWDSSNSSIPATTDFVSVKGDPNGGGQPITLEAYDVSGNLVDVDQKPDLGNTILSVSAPGIHLVRVHDNQAGTVAWDDLTFAALTIVTNVAIDIKPGIDPNAVNLKSHGVLPVAVLTSDEFDATTVDTSDLSQIRFGDVDLSEPSRVSPLRSAREDVDGDGDTDLVLHFSMNAINEAGALIATTTEAELTGLTVDGTAIRGTDSVQIVPRRTNGAATPVVATTALVPQKDVRAQLNGDTSGDPVPLTTQQRSISAAPDEPTAFLRRARHNMFQSLAPERVDSALADFDEDEDSLPAALPAALAGRLIA